MHNATRVQAAEAVAYIQTQSQVRPLVGLVLGSGLNTLAERVQQPDIISYEKIPHFPRSTVPGHSGRLILGHLNGAPVIIMQGRAHYYEGYSAAEITLPIRAMQLLGVRVLILTNAAGGIRRDLRAGDLMMLTDHINVMGFAGHNPLRGPNDDTLGPRFPDMSHAYDPELMAWMREEARNRNITLNEGVYAMVAGPSFETPAEIRYLRAIGADAVGMSTVPEVIVARHGGIRVLGISLISNIAVDSTTATSEETSHEQVLEAGKRAVPLLASLIEGLIGRLA